MAGSPNPLTGTNVFIATINAPGVNEDVSQAVMARALQPVLNNTVFLKTFVDARSLTTVPVFPADEGKLIVATATGGPLAVKTPAEAGVAASVHSHAQADITGLGTDLALKAPLASPALTGTPTAPTATAGTNTTQLATTAFVTTGLANKANATHTHGVVDLTAAGTRDATTFLRGDNTWATPASTGLTAAANETITGNWTFDGQVALTRGGRFMETPGAPARYLSNNPNRVLNPSGELGLTGWTVVTGAPRVYDEAEGGRCFSATAAFEMFTDVKVWRASKNEFVSVLPAFQSEGTEIQVELLDAANALLATLTPWTNITAAGIALGYANAAGWAAVNGDGYLRVRFRSIAVPLSDTRFRGVSVTYGVPALAPYPVQTIRWLYDNRGGGGGGTEGVPIDSDGRTTAYTTVTGGKPISFLLLGNGPVPRQRSAAQGGGTNWQHDTTTNALTFTAGMEPVTGEVITYWY